MLVVYMGYWLVEMKIYSLLIETHFPKAPSKHHAQIKLR